MTLDDKWLDLKYISTKNLGQLTLSQLRELEGLLKSERRSAFGNNPYRRKLQFKISMVQREIAELVPGAQRVWAMMNEGDLFMYENNLSEATRFYTLAGMTLMARACRLAMNPNIIPFDIAFNADARACRAAGG